MERNVVLLTLHTISNKRRNCGIPKLYDEQYYLSLSLIVNTPKNLNKLLIIFNNTASKKVINIPKNNIIKSFQKTYQPKELFEHNHCNILYLRRKIKRTCHSL